MQSTLTTPTAAHRRSRFAQRRATRAARARLRAELSTYTTEAERAELDAILARHTDEQVAELRALVR